MDKYEQEMFNFLTQRENFEAMLRMNSVYPTVKQNLLKEFWDAVAKAIEEKLLALQKEWKVFNPPNKEHHKAKMILYKESWMQNSNLPFVGLAWENLYTQPFYGVWYDVKSGNIDSQKLLIDLALVRNNHKMIQESEWWPAWRYGEYVLADDADITYILPDIRETTAEMYAERYLTFYHQLFK